MIRAHQRHGVLLILAALAAGLASPARAADAPQAPRWHTDVLVAFPRQLVVLRLFVRFGKRDLPEAWDKATTKFFQGCDADHNGVLAGPERRRVPTPEQLVSLGLVPGSAFKRAPSAAATVKPTTVKPASAKPASSGAADPMSLQQFKDYLLRAGVVAFLLQAGSVDSAAAESSEQAEGKPDNMFRALDADASGRLSQGELQRAWQNLHRYDLNEDDILSRDELLSSAARSRVRPALGAEFKLAATLASAGSARALALGILEQYDTGRQPNGTKAAPAAAAKDGRLSAAELGWTAEALKPFDADDNGRLDFDELLRLAANPTPTVQFTARQAGPSARSGLTSFVSGLFSGRGAADEAPNSAEWSFSGARIELNVNPASAVSGFIMQQRFAQADRDKNRYLDKQEAAIYGASGTALFQYLDFDGDGKVLEREWNTDGGRLLELAEAQTRLQITDLGQPFFLAIDADDNGRLDRHELGSIGERLSAWDADGNGALSPAEIPRQLRAVVSSEADLVNFSFNSSVVVTSSSGGSSSSQTTAAGPVWFRAMDRNGDGELSPPEFVGRLDRFQQLDADHDGFLSPAEADDSAAARGH